MDEKDLIELKVQLARIEENVSNIPEVKQELKDMSRLSMETHHRSLENERRIDGFDNKLTWITRTLGATIISIIAGLIFGAQ